MTTNTLYMKQIYRIKFSDSINEHLANFANIHQYDTRKDFKEAWQKWVTENNTIILQEKERQQLAGYKGDILDKMFTSTRYYHLRNKDNNQDDDEPIDKTKKIPLRFSSQLLKQMDEHISQQLKQHIHEKNINPNTTIRISRISPANSYEHYCQTHQQDILQEIITKKNNQMTIDPQIFSKKLKKTYKNRFFLVKE